MWHLVDKRAKLDLRSTKNIKKFYLQMQYLQKSLSGTLPFLPPSRYRNWPCKIEACLLLEVGTRASGPNTTFDHISVFGQGSNLDLAFLCSRCCWQFALEECITSEKEKRKNLISNKIVGFSFSFIIYLVSYYWALTEGNPLQIRE